MVRLATFTAHLDRELVRLAEPLALLVGLTSLLLGLRPAWGESPGASGTFVVGPEAARYLDRALPHDDRGDVLLGGLVFDRVKVGPDRLVFHRAPSPPEPPADAGDADAVLLATHPANPTDTSRWTVLAEDGFSRVFAAPGEASLLAAAASELSPRLRGLVWHRTEGEGSPGDSVVLSQPVWRWGAPIVLWLLLLPAVFLLIREARRALRPAPTSSPRIGLAALFVVALLLRLTLSSAWPLAAVEVSRIALRAQPEWQVLPLLAAPFSLLTADPLFVHAILGAILSALAVLVVAGLGTAWSTERRVGALAGLIVAVHPVQIRLAMAAPAAVTSMLLVLSAYLATEVLLRRRSSAAGLAAGILWALALHSRPEVPAQLAVLALWGLFDPRFRRLVRSRRLSPFVVPLALSLALDVIGTIVAGEPIPVAPLSQRYAANLAWSVWALFLIPDIHNPLVGLLAIVGAVCWRGRVRWLILGAGVAVPALTAALGSSMAAPLWHVEWSLRYVLAGHAVLAVLAALPLARLAFPPPGARGAAWRRSAGGLAIAAVSLSPLAYGGYLRTPAPLQVEQAFLARHAPTLPTGALLVVFGAENAGYDVAPPIDYRLRLARGLDVRDERLPSAVRTLDAVRELSEPAARPLFAFCGWFAHVAASYGLADEQDRFRAELARWWRMEELVCETHTTLPGWATGGNGDGAGNEMKLCLHRLYPRVRGR